jgi:hypothetical protein
MLEAAGAHRRFLVQILASGTTATRGRFATIPAFVSARMSLFGPKKTSAGGLLPEACAAMSCWEAVSPSTQTCLTLMPVLAVKLWDSLASRSQRVSAKS